MHPALKAFLAENADRFPDLSVTADPGGHLVLKFRDTDGAVFETQATVLNGDAYPWFATDDDGGGVSEPDPLGACALAFAHMIIACQEDDDEALSEVSAEPGTFAALVWSRAINLRLAGLDDLAKDLRAALNRLNPTTIADLPLFAAAADGEE